MTQYSAQWSLEHAPIGYALLEKVDNSNSGEMDLQFLEVNLAFGKMMGTHQSKIIGKSWKNLFPETSPRFKEPEELCFYSTHIDAWFQAKLENPQNSPYWVCYLSDISNEVYLTKVSEAFLENSFEEIDFQFIVDQALKFSKAKYGLFNLFLEDEKVSMTKAIAGVREEWKKITSMLGFSMIGKKWPYDPELAEKYGNTIQTKRMGLDELVQLSIPKPLVRSIQAIFGIGEAVVSIISKKEQILGNFTLLMPRHHPFENQQALEAYSRQVGLVLDRFNAEHARKQAEFKLQNLVQNVPGAVFQRNNDKEWSMRFISEDIETITGYPKEAFEKKQGLSYASLVDLGDRKRVYRQIQKAIRKEEAYEVDYQLTDSRGVVKWVRERGMPVIVDGRSDGRIDGVMIDVSERKHFEEALAKSKLDAEMASRAKSRFLSNMSHELRTPLTSMIGFAELLKDSELSDDQQYFLQQIIKPAKALKELLERIMEISKLEAKGFIVRNEPTHLGELCDQAIRMVELEARKKNVALLSEVDPQLPPIVMVDRVGINQVLINLVGNALKFTHKGSIMLKVHLQEKDEDQHRYLIRFEITDTGIGIAQEDFEKILKPFEQADDSDTRRYGGAGLGLAISQEILKAMGSDLHIHSEIGKGSTFSFDLRLTS